MPRRCYRIVTPEGHVGIITVDVRPKKCKACGDYVMPERQRECDWKLTGKLAGKTCDMLICDRCARHVGENKDLCPAHAQLWDQHPKNPRNQPR